MMPPLSTPWRLMTPCTPRRRCPLAVDAVIRDDDEHVLDAAAEGGVLDLERAAEVRRRSARSS